MNRLHAPQQPVPVGTFRLLWTLTDQSTLFISGRPSLQTRFVSLGYDPFCISAWVLAFEDRLCFFLAMCLLYVVLPHVSTPCLV
jgi:hypothetical protein